MFEFVSSVLPHAFVDTEYNDDTDAFTTSALLPSSSKAIPSSTLSSLTKATTAQTYQSVPSDPESENTSADEGTRSIRLGPASLTKGSVPSIPPPLSCSSHTQLVTDNSRHDGEVTFISKSHNKEECATGCGSCDGAVEQKSAGRGRAQVQVSSATVQDATLPSTSTSNSTTTTVIRTNSRESGDYSDRRSCSEERQQHSFSALDTPPHQPPCPSPPLLSTHTEFPAGYYILDPELIENLSSASPPPSSLQKSAQSTSSQNANLKKHETTTMSFLASSSNLQHTPPIASTSAPCDWRQPNDDEEFTQAGRTALLKADMMYMHDDDGESSAFLCHYLR